MATARGADAGQDFRESLIWNNAKGAASRHQRRVFAAASRVFTG